MTREEEIRRLAQHLANVWYAGANLNLEALFEQAVQWADEHPKNPWISVDDRLPDKWKRIKVQQGLGEECYSWITKDVFVIKDGWEIPEIAFYDYEAKIWWSEYEDNIENLFGEPTHWMPIPKIEKGE